MTAENKDFFEALSMLEHERGITAEYLIEKIKAAIIIAVKKNYEVEEDHIRVDIDPDTGRFDVALIQDIVADEDWYDEHAEIGVTEARKIRSSYEVGDRIITPLKTRDFGRIAAQTAKHVIRQGIRDSERDQMMQEFKGRHQELVSALVERVDPKTGALSLKIGKAEAILPKGEQVGTENVKEGDHVQVYVVDVKETEKGPKAIISRTHPDLIRRLFEKEVPEIFDGTVEIKAVAREAGSRTKIAVMSHNPDVDAVGACIGTRGTRVSDIVNELGGEKMDIVDYSEDPAKFIAAALAPATVLSVETAEDGSHVCKVTVPDSQLSLAIGNKGQNARLCARLTGYNIDIRPESGYYGEDEEPKKDAADAE